MSDGLPVDAWMMILAAIGAGRGIERAAGRGNENRLVVRLVLLLMLGLAAIDHADTWRNWLYAFLMPIGAYYVAAAAAEWIASHRRGRAGQIGSNPAA